MATLLVLIAALAAGNGPCPAVNNAPGCNAQPLMPVDAWQSPTITDDMGHIADVLPPGKRRTAAAPAAPARSAPAPEAVPDPTPPPEPEPLAAAITATEAAPSEDADAIAMTADWVVQIAAFGDRDAAEEGAQRIDREGVVIVPTRRDGEDWYVLLLGSYPSRAEADRAGSNYATLSGGSYWVREKSAIEMIQRTKD